MSEHFLGSSKAFEILANLGVDPLMPVLTIDRTVFFFLFFFLADLSYVGFVLVSDFWDISDRKQISLFVSKNKSSPMDLFLS